MAVSGPCVNKEGRTAHQADDSPLSQGLDRNQRPLSARAIPVVAKLRSTKFSPLDHQTTRPHRKLACDQLKGLDVDRRLVLAISGMEVGPSQMPILVVIHPDRDAVEAADSRHRTTLDSKGAQNKARSCQKALSSRYLLAAVLVAGRGGAPPGKAHPAPSPLQAAADTSASSPPVDEPRGVEAPLPSGGESPLKLLVLPGRR